MLKEILEEVTSKNEGQDIYDKLVDLLDSIQYGKKGKKGEKVYQDWISANYYDTSDYTGHDSDDEQEWLSIKDDAWCQEQFDFLMDALR
jgi:intein/homing endonuclease